MADFAEFVTEEDLERAGVLPRIGPDLRRHKRVSLSCLGRYMREDRSEHTCRLVDVSVGGASIHSLTTVRVGEKVIAYFDEIGRIEGAVVRSFDGGFAIQMNLSQHRREKLAAQLTWMINRKTLGIPDARRHDRAMSNAPVEAQMTLADRAIVTCRVLDVSISGASIAIEPRPVIGMNVLLGRLRAKVVRHHDNGVGLQFLDIQNPAALRRHFG